MVSNTTPVARPVKIPGKVHPITIERNPSRVVVTVAGKVIVDTQDALTLRGPITRQSSTSRERIST
jgi:uncharacterized protein (DUF427 family)